MISRAAADDEEECFEHSWHITDVGGNSKVHRDALVADLQLFESVNVYICDVPYQCV